MDASNDTATVCSDDTVRPPPAAAAYYLPSMNGSSQPQRMVEPSYAFQQPAVPHDSPSNGSSQPATASRSESLHWSFAFLHAADQAPPSLWGNGLPRPTHRPVPEPGRYPGLPFDSLRIDVFLPRPKDVAVIDGTFCISPQVRSTIQIEAEIASNTIHETVNRAEAAQIISGSFQRHIKDVTGLNTEAVEAAALQYTRALSRARLVPDGCSDPAAYHDAMALQMDMLVFRVVTLSIGIRARMAVQTMAMGEACQLATLPTLLRDMHSTDDPSHPSRAILHRFKHHTGWCRADTVSHTRQVRESVSGLRQLYREANIENDATTTLDYELNRISTEDSAIEQYWTWVSDVSSAIENGRKNRSSSV
ncbi:hypothetical protein SPBR_00783 [Sporothrix brasiliensis 5110]|uniref:Uncharacterized protein n=1 Tax=Sporothrix brasiliensis 5110 TaxID=1398154 RepID=A0A0C2IVW1_9PEZI|nr:uncharacterized protein SPBR_00783 [Sporothrix brasiliensis 5110]KIH90930.1 hypothetical protein SPBR_00783 [Sporothrix brasiliensis 5110]